MTAALMGRHKNQDVIRILVRVCGPEPNPPANRRGGGSQLHHHIITTTIIIIILTIVTITKNIITIIHVNQHHESHLDGHDGAGFPQLFDPLELLHLRAGIPPSTVLLLRKHKQ